MNRLKLFLSAMQAEEHKRRAWVISAFSLIREGPDDWKKDPYPFRIVQTQAGHFFVDPENENKLSPIDDTKAGEAVYLIKDQIDLPAGSVPNLTKDITTSYGNLLFNYVAVIYPFLDKIPYQEGRVSTGQMEDLIILRLKDNPEHELERNDKDIYVDEYLKFCNAMFYLAGFTQLCVPAATRKTMTAAPGIIELRNKLISENKDRLSDPAVIAKIDAALVLHDREYMKGDVGEGYLIKDKSYNIVRKKLFGMVGGEAGFSDGLEMDLIQNSLSEGWDPKDFPALNDSLRAGSFNRGAETMKGGEAVKWLYRASSNISVGMADCGSRLGNTIVVDGNNYNWLTGFSVIKEKGSELVPDEAAAKTYIGKTVMVRSPMFCKLEHTEYCSCCVGTRLSENPTGLSVAVADYGSKMMYIFMQAMHGKQLSLAKMNYLTAIQ